MRKRVMRRRNGYVYLYEPAHPYADITGYVREHRLIAEKAVGRYLSTSIPIHHVNEIKSDNRPQNLVICEDTAYHSLLHARARVLRAGFDPDRFLWCAYCQTCHEKDKFGRDRNRTVGYASACIDSANARRRSRRLDPVKRQRINAVLKAWRHRQKSIVAEVVQ